MLWGEIKESEKAVHEEDYGGWWLSGLLWLSGRALAAQARGILVWLPVTASLFTFLYFCLITSKIQNLEIDAQRGTDTLELGSLPTFGFWKLLYEIFSFRCLLTDHKYYLRVKFQCMWWSATYQFFDCSIVAKKGPRPGSLDSMLFQNLVWCVYKAWSGEGTDKG